MTEQKLRLLHCRYCNIEFIEQIDVTDRKRHQIPKIQEDSQTGNGCYLY